MTNLQKEIKEQIEKFFEEEYNETLVVEFVSDVLERVNEIIRRKSRFQFRNRNEETTEYGKFCPPVSQNDTYHIFIWNGLKDGRELMTSAHELEHAILFVNLLRTVFQNNRSEMSGSKFAEYYQVFSEFSAYRKGMNFYLRSVSPKGFTTEDIAVDLLEEKFEFWQNKIFDESRLMYNSVLLGNILGALDVVESEKIASFRDKLDNDEKIKKVYDVMCNYKDEKEWYDEYINVVEDYYRD